MNIDPQQIHTFRVEFDAGNLVPPPFHYAYTLEVQFREPAISCSYEIRYLHREDLTDEEILEEGFTLNDDWKWQGNLPKDWQKAIFEQIQKQSWPKKPEKPNENEARMEIKLLDQSGNVFFKGRPADPTAWEYFLQELIQAIYEVAGKEAPFQLEYREIASGQEPITIKMEASFAHRTIKAEKQVDNQTEVVQPEWKGLKNLMKWIYLPDYDYEKAREQEPKKRGKYLNTGEGLWFKFEESLLEPDKKSESLKSLEETLKGLFKDRTKSR